MELKQLNANLAGLSIRQLVAAMRVLNNGPLGYDFSKKSKAELQRNAYELAFEHGKGLMRSLHISPLEANSRVWGKVQEALKPEEFQGGGAEVGTDSEGLPQAGNEGGESEREAEGEAEAPKPRQSRKGKTPEERLLDAIRDMNQGPSDEELADMIEKRVSAEVEKRVKNYRLVVEAPQFPDAPQEGDDEPKHYIVTRILRALGAGLNVYLVGPAGCGKTHIAKQCAKALGLPFGFTGAVGSEFKLLGYRDANGVYRETEFYKRYSEGGLFLKDEIDASCANAVLAVNAGLANGAQDFPVGIVPKHEKFVLIAAANTYGHGADRVYVGRNQMDGAALDRYVIIPMDYDEELERTLFGDTEWVRFVQSARKAVRQLNMRHIVSMRAIENGAKLLAAGESRENVEESCLWKQLAKAEIDKIRAAM